MIIIAIISYPLLRFRRVFFGFPAKEDITVLLAPFKAAACRWRIDASQNALPVDAIRLAALSHVLKYGFFTTALNPVLSASRNEQKAWNIFFIQHMDGVINFDYLAQP